MSPIPGILLLLLALLAAAPPAQAVAVPVTAGANSVDGGAGVQTYAVLAGEGLSVAALPGGSWRAGPGLAATGAEGLAGTDFTWQGITLPLGALVGEIAGLYRLLGGGFSGPAWAGGTLRLFHWGSAGPGVEGRIEAQVALDSATPGVIPPAATPVPAPAGAWLFGAGLLALAGLRRRG